MLTVNFELKDALSGTGMIVILLPQKIKKITGSLSVELSSSITSGTGKIKQFPTVSYYLSQQTIPSLTNTTSFVCPLTGDCLVLTNLIDNVTT